MRAHVIASAFLALAIAPVSGRACTCLPPPPGVRTTSERTSWYANRSDAVFEGTVRSIELKSRFMEAKIGELVSANADDDFPFLMVSLDITRSYRGAQKETTVVRTGLGGGDCGFDFEIGKEYLVYADFDEAGHLATGICNGTALAEDSIASVAYLRNEAPPPEDANKIAPAEKATLCGRIVGPELPDAQVFLVPVGRKFPMRSDEAEPGSDGAFCFTNVAPGKYYLAHVTGDEASPTSFEWFPGVQSLTEATPVEANEEQKGASGLLFKLQGQPTFSVSGTVLITGNQGPPEESKVALFSSDLSNFPVGYAQDIQPDGSFEFPHVLAGHYWGLVMIDSDPESKWLTRKVEVEVKENLGHLSLELLQK